jgi:2-phospho-L-lactate guanylyltransferase
VLRDDHDHGQSAAALIGIRHALDNGFERTLLVPGDAPLLDPAELTALLGHTEPLVIVPDRHGSGTNALALAPPDAIEPSFGEGSCARHVAAARDAGVPFGVEELSSLALDLDTPADVVALTMALEREGGRAKRTARALGI